jgi:hypothetical protein
MGVAAWAQSLIWVAPEVSAAPVGRGCLNASGRANLVRAGRWDWASAGMCVYAVTAVG